MGMSQQGQFGGGKGSQAQLGGQMGQPGMMYPGGSPGGGLAGLGGARGNWGGPSLANPPGGLQQPAVMPGGQVWRGGNYGQMGDGLRQQKLQSLLGQQRQLGGGFMSGPSAPNAWGGGAPTITPDPGGTVWAGGSPGWTQRNPGINLSDAMEARSRGMVLLGDGAGGTREAPIGSPESGYGGGGGYGRPGGVPGTIGGFGGYQGPGVQNPWAGRGPQGLRPPPQYGGPFTPRMPGGPFGGYNPAQQWASQFSPFGGYGGGGKGMSRVQPFNPMMQRLF